MRCASGTLWYDGWCLDAHSRSLVVEFQDKRTQLSARDLAACLEKEGGKHAWISADYVRLWGHAQPCSSSSRLWH